MMNTSNNSGKIYQGQVNTSMNTNMMKKSQIEDGEDALDNRTQ